MKWEWRAGRLLVTLVEHAEGHATVMELDADQASELRHTLGAALLERSNDRQRK